MDAILLFGIIFAAVVVPMMAISFSAVILMIPVLSLFKERAEFKTATLWSILLALPVQIGIFFQADKDHHGMETPMALLFIWAYPAPTINAALFGALLVIPTACVVIELRNINRNKILAALIPAVTVILAAASWESQGSASREQRGKEIAEAKETYHVVFVDQYNHVVPNVSYNGGGVSTQTGPDGLGTFETNNSYDEQWKKPPGSFVPIWHGTGESYIFTNGGSECLDDTHRRVQESDPLVAELKEKYGVRVGPKEYFAVLRGWTISDDDLAWNLMHYGYRLIAPEGAGRLVFNANLSKSEAEWGEFGRYIDVMPEEADRADFGLHVEISCAETQNEQRTCNVSVSAKGGVLPIGDRHLFSVPDGEWKPSVSGKIVYGHGRVCGYFRDADEKGRFGVFSLNEFNPGEGGNGFILMAQLNDDGGRGLLSASALLVKSKDLDNQALAAHFREKLDSWEPGKKWSQGLPYSPIGGDYEPFFPYKKQF